MVRTRSKSNIVDGESTSKATTSTKEAASYAIPKTKTHTRSRPSRTRHQVWQERVTDLLCDTNEQTSKSEENIPEQGASGTSEPVPMDEPQQESSHDNDVDMPSLAMDEEKADVEVPSADDPPVKESETSEMTTDEEATTGLLDEEKKDDIIAADENSVSTYDIPESKTIEEADSSLNDEKSNEEVAVEVEADSVVESASAEEKVVEASEASDDGPEVETLPKEADALDSPSDKKLDSED